MTPSNQNAVAYTVLKSWKDQGLNPAQIAAKWNSGSETGWENKVGVNKYGVKYDVPKYVKSVTDAYQTIKGGGDVQADPANPSSTAAPQNQQGILSKIGQGASNIIGAAGEGLIGLAAAPVQALREPIANAAEAIGRPLVSALSGGKMQLERQVPQGEVADPYSEGMPVGMGSAHVSPLSVEGKVGDAAQVGSYFIPGGGVGGGILKQGLKGAVQGATMGALQGGGAAMSREQSAEDVARAAKNTGALGAITGGVLGAASGGISNLAARTPEARLTEHSGLQKLQKSIANNSTKETNPIKTLTENNLIKELSVDGSRVNVDGLTNAGGTGKLDDLISNHADDASHLIDSLEGGVPLKQLRDDILKEVQNNPEIRDAGKVDQAIAEVSRRFNSFEGSFGETIPWKAVDNIRKAMNKDWNPETRDVARTIGDVARKHLYNGSGTNEAIKTAMKNEAELIKARNFAEALRGTVVKGGRLGKYFWNAMGAAGGSAVGSLFSPLGAPVGMAAGAMATDQIMKRAQGQFFNPAFSKSAGVMQNLINKPGAKAAGIAAKGLLPRLMNTGN
jgi:hypothetical protein